MRVPVILIEGVKAPCIVANAEISASSDRKGLTDTVRHCSGYSLVGSESQVAADYASGVITLDGIVDAVLVDSGRAGTSL